MPKVIFFHTALMIVNLKVGKIVREKSVTANQAMSVTHNSDLNT